MSWMKGKWLSELVLGEELKNIHHLTLWIQQILPLEAYLDHAASRFSVNFKSPHMLKATRSFLGIYLFDKGDLLPSPIAPSIPDVSLSSASKFCLPCRDINIWTTDSIRIASSCSIWRRLSCRILCHQRNSLASSLVELAGEKQNKDVHC